MFWFVTIFLIVTICAGAIGFAIGIRLLKFGEEGARQERTLRIVVISFLEIIVGGFALAALVTHVVDPIVALIVTVGTLLLAQLSFRIRGTNG
ncbi:MAG: hypothetical protein ACREBC_26570 [Pyrinomonadaceae bacterium]